MKLEAVLPAEEGVCYPHFMAVNWLHPRKTVVARAATKLKWLGLRRRPILLTVGPCSFSDSAARLRRRNQELNL